MPLKEFKYDGGDFLVTQDMIDTFNKDGVLLVRNLLSNEEVTKVLNQVELPNGILSHCWESPDGQGNKTKRVIWSHPGDDVTGMVARSQKVAGTVTALFGGEVYQYHAKVMAKEPKVGGEHYWHQDYGYWYKNGCLKPDLLTSYIALDKCRKQNGCLQVLLGSHQCGMIEHYYDEKTNQTVANVERVKQLQNKLEMVYCELDPGDCIFFHCNLLHMAGQNKSDMRRYCYLCAYNKADNDPVYKHHHPFYTPLEQVANSAIMGCTSTDLTGKEFMEFTTYVQPH